LDAIHKGRVELVRIIMNEVLNTNTTISYFIRICYLILVKNFKPF